MVPSGSSSPLEIYEGSPQELEKLFDPISPRDFLKLCVQCLHLAERAVGRPTKPYGAINQELRSYVSSTFAEVVQASSEEKLARLAARLPEAQVELLVTVVQAEGLVASDVSGKSDPYCVLRVGGAGSEEVYLTSVKSSTVCPAWDESFRIRVPDPDGDVFELAVWDKDPRTVCGVCRELRDVRSCASCVHFLRELFETLCSFDGADDFMGTASVFVNEIPCTGYERWLRLGDAGGRGAYGRVYVRFGFECRPRKRFDRRTVLRYHYYLCLVFLLQRVSTVARDVPLSWIQWEQCLAEEGLTLLYRHSQYHNLSLTEQLLCQVTALTNVVKTRKDRVNFSVLYRLLAQMRCSIKESQDQFIANSLEVVVKALAEPCLGRLARLHESFSFAKKYERVDLLGLLFCCVTIEALVEIEVTDPASVEIRKDASAWYQRTLTRESAHDDDALVHMTRRVLSTIDTYHEEADRIFKSAWNETYTDIVHKELDVFICKAFQTRVSNFCSTLVSQSADVSGSKKVEESLQLFYLLQGFHKRTSKVLGTKRGHLKMDGLQDWFGFDLVLLWFDLARTPVSRWISDLVSKDAMFPLACDIKYGAAVRDTVDILHARYVLLWQTLELRSFQCARAFTVAVSDDCSYFVRCLSSRVESAGYFDVVGEFEVSTQLCVAISSFARVAAFLQETITQVDVVCLSDGDIARRATEARLPLEKALDESLIAMSRVCAEAANKLKPELRKRVSCVADASSRHSQDRALHELVQYVNACIGTLRDHLDDIAFHKMLRLLWRIVISSIKEEASLVQENYLYRFTTASLSFLGLHKALFQLRDVFHAEGAGLPPVELDIKPYVALDGQLHEIVRALAEHDATLSKDAAVVIV